jgi:transcription elongation factor
MRGINLTDCVKITHGHYKGKTGVVKKFFQGSDHYQFLATIKLKQKWRESLIGKDNLICVPIEYMEIVK